MIIAIPKFNDLVAPCFEVACTFLIASVEVDHDISINIEKCDGCEGFSRIRLLKDNHVELLICNGIKGFYKDILVNSGISVIDSISSPVEKALSNYRKGILKPKSSRPEIYSTEEIVPLNDVICWTKDLFKSNGYSIVQGNQRAPFPVDLVAELKCPVCGKPIRIAICCGAHSYRIDQELLEFHRVSSSDYHAKIYIHSTEPDIAKRCDEFGIELIDPFADHCESFSGDRLSIPVLKKPITGHEKAWIGNIK